MKRFFFLILILLSTPVWADNEVTADGRTGKGHVIYDESTKIKQREGMSFAGSGVSVADTSGKTVVTISGGASGDIEGVTAGTALDGGGASGTVTLDFDPTEITGGTTWDDGGEASVIWTYNLTGTDPTLTFGSGSVAVGGNLIAPNILGGTSTTQDLSLQTTSGVGASGADMHFLVGNNGATEAMTILNSGNVGIGNTAPDAQLEINHATGDSLRLTYNDSNGSAANYADFAMSSSGDLTITPSGGNLSIPASVDDVTAINSTTESTMEAALDIAGEVTSTGMASTVIADSITVTGWVMGTSTATTQSANDNSTKLATTAYADNILLEQNYKEAARVATTANLVGTYLAGVFTYTATGTNDIDGVTLALNDRVLVKNQTTTSENGIYKVTTAGALGIAGVLTRSTDADNSTDFVTGDMIFITAGTTQSSTTWAYTGIDSPTIGTTAITFVQVAGQGSFTGGSGITITGTSIALTTPVTVALGGTNATSASITAFNNITGYTASGATGTTSTNLVFSTSPALTTPALGAATYTTLVGGAVTASGKIIGDASIDVKNGATSSGVLAIFEDSDAGTNKATFEVPALAADTVYILPTTDGAADEFLQSNGSGTLTWAAGGAAAAGELTSVQVFTGSGTWTKPAGITKTIVEVVGGGGNGGASSAGESGSGGGGGGGAAVELFTSPSASETVTVGAAGGTSSFGTLTQATGGSVGANGGAFDSSVPGGAGGIGSLGTINMQGQGGSSGLSAPTYPASAFGGAGGMAAGNFGGGGGRGLGNAGGAGVAGGIYGGGGGGSAQSATVGAGAGGIVVVWEYT